jgi:hypothetical protein
MKIIKANLMAGPNMPFMGFQFGVSVQAESLLLGNLDWEELPPMDPMGNPLPEWEASQAREKGHVMEQVEVSPTVMVTLLENMGASEENHEKAKGSAFNPVRDVLLGALQVAKKHGNMTVHLLAMPMDSEDFEDSEDESGF